MAQLVEDVGVRVYPVGRLDKDSEGLLLLTNDGDFANQVAHPSAMWPRPTGLPCGPAVTEEQLNQMSTGIVIEGRRTAPAKLRVLQQELGPGWCWRSSCTKDATGRSCKMCEALGLEVARLKRIAVGPVRLGMLPQGKYRELTKEELRALAAEAKKGSANHDPSEANGGQARRGKAAKGRPGSPPVRTECC